MAQFGAGNSSGADPPLPDLLTALQEQAGLKLEPAKGPVDVYVIDHVEKPSAELIVCPATAAA